MAEVPNHSVEELQSLPLQVTWSDTGYTSLLHGSRKVYGEFFSIDLTGYTDEELETYDNYVTPPATCSGSIKYTEDGEKYLSAGTLAVDPAYRRNHLGERLSKTLAWIAADQGCKGIDADFAHPASLKIFRNIFGDERIQFRRKTLEGKLVPWNISPREAIGAIKKERADVVKYGVRNGIWKHHPKTDEEVLPGAVDGVNAWIDMEGFDVSVFEQPIQTGTLPDSHVDAEFLETNPLEYPRGYFEAQVRFAQKWAELSGENFADTLLTKTALYRRIMGAPLEGDIPEQWTDLVANLDSRNATSSTYRLYEAYESDPNSYYQAPKETSAFGYDYEPNTQTVKLHFTNPVRGERPLSEENMDKRREEIREMLREVRETHPEAALLMSATWLRSTSHYSNFSPPNIAEPENLMSTRMKLTGNSVWGQFIDASGNVNQRVYDMFVEAVQLATTLDELMAAFPYQTLKAEDPIEKYYQHYGIDEPSPNN